MINVKQKSAYQRRPADLFAQRAVSEVVPADNEKRAADQAAKTVYAQKAISEDAVRRANAIALYDVEED